MLCRTRLSRIRNVAHALNVLWAMVAVTLGVCEQVQASSPRTALLDYVNAPDGAYQFTTAGILMDGNGFKIYLLDMTSQRWRTETEVWHGGAEADAPRSSVWRHWLSVVVPDKLTTDTALIVVAGGDNDDDPPSAADENIVLGAQLAALSGSVVAVVQQVPNQPLFFADEPFAHTEDEIVAYSWDKAMATRDYSWPVYLPMVKSVVRAMDTVQEFVPMVVPQAPITDFVVAGFSKRGAVTWLTGAVDARVKAIAPGVIDIVNFVPQIEHHLAVYGDYSPAIQDYVDYDIVTRGRTPEGQGLIQVVDPLSYLTHLQMPKLIINATGDQFFLPDSTRFYFSKLKGEALLRYVPNTDHSLSTSTDAIVNAASGLFSWYLNILYDIPRPLIEWNNQHGRLTVSSSQPVLAALLWQTTNPNARDFRRDTIGEAWAATGLGSAGGQAFVAEVAAPPQGWTAYFVELIYPPRDHGLCQTYSTQVYVTPDVRPFETLDPVQDPEDIQYPANPPAQTALNSNIRGAFPDTLPLAELNGFVSSVLGSSDVLALLPDEVTTRLGEECPNLALANLAVRDLDQEIDETIDRVQDEVTDELEHVGSEVVDTTDDVLDEASDLGQEVADWF